MHKTCLWNQFISFVYAITDTLPILKKLPDRAKAKLKFNQSNLAKDLLDSYNMNDSHNALQDVQTLENILKKQK